MNRTSTALRTALCAAAVLALTTACASSRNDQNRLLDEDPERFNTERHSDAEQTNGGSALFATAEVQDVETRAADTEPAAVVADRGAPTLFGLDRSHWPAVTTRTDRGIITVQAHYFEDFPTYASRPGRPTEPLQSEAQKLDTLRDSKADNLSARNLGNMVGQPLNFALDTVLFPLRMVITPPWRNVADETAGHDRSYVAGNTREPVPADTADYRVRMNPATGGVYLVDVPESDPEPSDDDADL